MLSAFCSRPPSFSEVQCFYALGSPKNGWQKVTKKGQNTVRVARAVIFHEVLVCIRSEWRTFPLLTFGRRGVGRHGQRFWTEVLRIHENPPTTTVIRQETYRNEGSQGRSVQAIESLDLVASDGSRSGLGSHHLFGLMDRYPKLIFSPTALLRFQLPLPGPQGSASHVPPRRPRRGYFLGGLSGEAKQCPMPAERTSEKQKNLGVYSLDQCIHVYTVGGFGATLISGVCVVHSEIVLVACDVSFTSRSPKNNLITVVVCPKYI